MSNDNDDREDSPAENGDDDPFEEMDLDDRDGDPFSNLGEGADPGSETADSESGGSDSGGETAESDADATDSESAPESGGEFEFDAVSGADAEAASDEQPAERAEEGRERPTEPGTQSDSVAATADEQEGDPFEVLDAGADRSGDPFEAFQEGAEGADDWPTGEEPQTDETATTSEGRDDLFGPPVEETSDDSDPSQPGDPLEKGPEESPFDSVESVFEEMGVDDLDPDSVWESLSEAETRGSVSEHAGSVYAEVSKHRFCEQCEWFSEPPDATCTHEGTEIVEFLDMETVRVMDCPVVAERRELEKET